MKELGVVDDMGYIKSDLTACVDSSGVVDLYVDDDDLYSSSSFSLLLERMEKDRAGWFNIAKKCHVKL